MKTLVLGLGNPILGDDGVGWAVVEALRARALPLDVELDCCSLGGLSLMERMSGYECAVLIDAIYTGEQPVGTLTVFPLVELDDVSAGHTTSAHDTSLRNALNVGRSMGIPLPKDEHVYVVAVEAEKVYDFAEELSPAVAAAVPQAVEAVLRCLTKAGE